MDVIPEEPGDVPRQGTCDGWAGFWRELEREARQHGDLDGADYARQVADYYDREGPEAFVAGGGYPCQVPARGGATEGGQ